MLIPVDEQIYSKLSQAAANTNQEKKNLNGNYQPQQQKEAVSVHLHVGQALPLVLNNKDD